MQQNAVLPLFFCFSVVPGVGTGLIDVAGKLQLHDGMGAGSKLHIEAAGIYGGLLSVVQDGMDGVFAVSTALHGDGAALDGMEVRKLQPRPREDPDAAAWDRST